jgi:hypothetical protein
VVEYAVQNLFKRQSPRVAARNTVKKLHGQENLLLGPGTTHVDAGKLETALWGRLVSAVAETTAKFKPGMGHVALQSVAEKFNLGARDTATLKRMVDNG